MRGTLRKNEMKQKAKSCSLCGHPNSLNYVHNMQDLQCRVCGAFQRLEYQKVTMFNHKWYDILPINGCARKLVRVSWRGELKRCGYVNVVVDYPNIKAT